MPRSDQLSRAATVLRRYTEEIQDGAEDISLWGAPSECMDIVAKYARLRRDARLLELGYGTVDAVVEEITMRTSARWVFYNLCVEG
jgi:hypothetical protein